VLLLQSGRSAGGDGVLTDLLACFLDVPDRRAPRWVEHPLAAVLALCAGAVVAGMCSFTAVAGWIADVPADLLDQLFLRCGAGPTGPPSKATVWRVVTGVDAGPVDAAIGAWLLARAAGKPDSDTAASAAVSPVALAVDGKTVRGASDHEGNQVHLLAAMTHDQGLVAAQTEVHAKTTEIPCATLPSAPTASPATPTSPKPPAGPTEPSTARSTSSDSHHDLETAVIPGVSGGGTDTRLRSDEGHHDGVRLRETWSSRAAALPNGVPHADELVVAPGRVQTHDRTRHNSDGRREARLRDGVAAIHKHQNLDT